MVQCRMPSRNCVDLLGPMARSILLCVVCVAVCVWVLCVGMPVCVLCVCCVWVLSEVRVYTTLNGTFRAYSLVP